MIQFIFGLGSGRCGTGTLAKLLDKQKGISSSHEGQFCPWEKDLVAFYQSIIGLVNETTEPRIATVAFYWRNYLSEIFRDFKNPKLIVLKREKQKVVESFASLYQDKNHWSDPEGKNWDGRDPKSAPLAAMFPKYDLSKKDAIAQYWEDYYNDGELKYWMKRFPRNIMLIRSEKFWEGEEAQKKIFRFLGIPKKEMVFDTSIWAHKRPEKENVLTLDRPMPKEMQNWGKNRALYGSAARHSGIPTEMEFQLTEEEFNQIKDHPDIKRLIKENAQREEKLNA